MRPDRVEGQPNSVASVMELSMDRKRDLLYVNNYWRYHVKSGTWESIAKPEGVPGWGRPGAPWRFQ